MAKKRSIIRKGTNSEMSEIDNEIDKALQHLESTNLRIEEMLASLGETRASGNDTKEINGTTTEGDIAQD